LYYNGSAGKIVSKYVVNFLKRGYCIDIHGLTKVFKLGNILMICLSAGLLPERGYAIILQILVKELS